MGCDVGCEKKKKNQEQPKDFGLGNQKDRIIRKRDSKALGRIVSVGRSG